VATGPLRLIDCLRGGDDAAVASLAEICILSPRRPLSAGLAFAEAHEGRVGWVVTRKICRRSPRVAYETREGKMFGVRFK
jgi:hypothetical protein